jgi:hypothetical protein
MAGCVASILTLIPGPSFGQAPRDQLTRLAQWTAVVVRATECGFLAPWEERVFMLKGLSDEPIDDLSEAQLALLNVQTTVAVAWTPCSSPAITVLAMLRAMPDDGPLTLLAQHLELFRSLSAMETLPQLLLDSAHEIDPTLAVPAIDRLLSRWTEAALLWGDDYYYYGAAQRFPTFAEDALVEGNGTYRAVVDRLAHEITAAASGAESVYVTRSQAIDLISNAITVTALWIADGCPFAVAGGFGLPDERIPDYERLDQCRPD